uniref:SCO-spondin n=1 Tax=Gasterosteus aculeatus aculeatus TaxID=481459 RepID=G3N7U1_GASAC
MVLLSDGNPTRWCSYQMVILPDGAPTRWCSYPMYWPIVKLLWCNNISNLMCLSTSRPPETENLMVNKTVRTCCEGWGGPRCSEGVGVRGRCFSTWSCEDFPGVHNSSLMPMEQCCSTLWGLSWKNASDQTCLSCSYTLLPGQRSSPLVRGGLLGSVRAPQSSATCMSWGGAHYRTFDRKHFHFQGSCTYLLASSTDGTWAVYITTVCDGRGDCNMFREGHSWVVHWLGDFVFVESGLGVRVKFDLTNTVYLTVTGEHLAATRGLCGVYDNSADDDFTTMGGAVSQFAASFGNSWKVPDQQNEGCSDAAELGHSCDVSGDEVLQGRAESVCRRLLEDPFTHCHQRPAAYMDTCLYLYCSLPPKDRDSAVCDTLASYARECAQLHVIIVWRTNTLCGRVCPRGQVFSDCVSSCSPSCASPQPPGPAAAMGQCREECVGGCECPRDLYLHQGLCLTRDKCPCFHRRRTYQSGERIQQRCNTCLCRAGQWQCTGEKCAAQCSLIGALQVTTFDKKRYSLQGGDCSYTAVEVRFITCDHANGLGCLREMSVTALRTTVTITDTGTVMLNGLREPLPVITGDLVVRRVSSSFLLIQAFGAQLLWHLDGPLALITLQPGFANKVRGLCGTLTWNQHDDFLTPQGDVENSVSLFASKFTTEHCAPPRGALPDPCTTFTQRRQYAETVCSVIHSPVFQACHDMVEREPFFRLCLSEVCSCTPQRSCHCTILTAYGRQCAQEGVTVHWRNQTFCAVQCSGGQVYQECGGTCGGSCFDSRSCDAAGGGTGLRLCVPGCQCPLGLVQDHQGQCVPINMCPCVEGDKTYQPGARIQNNCNTCVCERGLFNCTQERCEEVTRCPGHLVYSPRSCLPTCSSLDQQQGSGVAHESCREALSACVCPRGTVLLDDRCVLPEDCPCHHNGRLYFSNETITKDCNTCVCKERRWHCSQSACTGVCVATGDPHYVTFDGRCYSFLGDCQYVLAEETNGLFSVMAENVPCGSTGVTCTKSVTLSLGNTVIHLLRGKAVAVNGMPVSLPKSYSGSGLTLERVGLFVSLSSQLGVTLLWDGGMRVYVRLAAHLRGRVRGLCGNFDGDTENDFTTRQGIAESTAELFGNSWKVSPSCPDVADQDLRDPCAINTHRVPWARKRCAVLTQELFSQCHPEVPFQQYYDWCVYDACGCDSGGDCECLCTAIAAYAEECNHRGVYIRWRSQELCPMQCDNGLVYDPCGPACSHSCPSVQPSPHSQCGALSCVEGCFCPAGTVRHGDSCVVIIQCPCEWEGSMFPPGTVITQHCQNCSCEVGVWQCRGVACPPAPPPCLDSEYTCAGGRCIPIQWVCDNEEDCGDGSDEICPSTCPPDNFQCTSTPSGPCLNLALRCDGHPDCSDQSDEEFCVTCAPDQFACSDGTCVATTKVCDGTLDCGGGEDENRTNCYITPSPSPVSWTTPTSGTHLIIQDIGFEKSVFLLHTRVSPACRSYELSCATGGQCVPQAWRCDGETDCMDGSDEQQCTAPCGPVLVPCLSGDQCVDYQQLCDGILHCRDASDESIDNCGEPLNTTLICPEFTCTDGSCVPFNMVCNGVVDCPNSSQSPLGGPTDEQGCRTWSSWGLWTPCSTSCGTGSRSRQRTCPAGDPLSHCKGQESQRQQCFNTTCPVDGLWLPWVSWANCSSGCGGVQVRHRGCIPPLYGGRDCFQLPGPSNLPTEISKPCPDDGCANTTCPTGLVRHSCAPCPVSCAHISSGTSCDAKAPCYSGCWCPEGQVMSHTQQCVSPEECVCEAAGVRYWPGQQIKIDCEICVCERGRTQRCQPNPDCSVHCGWSSWTEWGECLGPCGVQSVQWSFRSPNNPIKHGDGRACRGIYRKARRCQTNPCNECEYQGRSHAVGDRWRSDHCQVCHCLPNSTVQCSLYCPHAVSGCPQGQSLVHVEGDRCCYCQGKIRAVVPLICTSHLMMNTIACLTTNCTFSLTDHPFFPPRGIIHIFFKIVHAADLPQRSPEAQTSNTQSPYLQMDLLKAYNITGVLTQGGGAFGTFVSSFYLQFSRDGRQWYTYKELITDARPRAKVFYGNHDDGGVAEIRLDRTVVAQFVRLLPHDFQNGIYLRLEIMGCGDGLPRRCPYGQFSCPPPGGCINAGLRCDGIPHCPKGEDETGYELVTPNATTPYDGGRPRVLCVEGQFACRTFGCINLVQVCDGGRDCLDGSDEEHCGTTPHVPSPCSPKQFSCDSGECVHLDRRCDLQKDCVDGSDERDCVDCIMSPWTAWSACSVSCGLGSLFRQRDILREALPGGSCGGAQFDSRACFPRACPVDGHWSQWTEWSLCDTQCGGGVRRRNRTCSAPPPKNGGRDCEGMTLQSQSCNSKPCTEESETQTGGCVNGMVLVTERDCTAGGVQPCPPTCSHLSMTSNCTAACIPGCRCADGLYLQEGRCVNGSQCVCLWDGQTLQPGETVSKDHVCMDGQVTCDTSLCVATCQWSAWSSWSPCDVTCGLGLQQRYRSPLNPAGAIRIQPCAGDSSEARRCSGSCFPGKPTVFKYGVWGKWTSWSECSKTCFNHVDDVGIRLRFRSCNHTLTAFNGTVEDSACDGDGEDQEPCNTVHCPVNGGWSAWSSWSQCSSECDSGVQTRERLCSSPTPQHGGSNCPGPHIQTGDCNSHPCSGVCPEGMVHMTSAECEARGAACPRVCLDMTAGEVQCVTACYNGCYCSPGLYLLKGRCVPLGRCPCYHQGELYPAGAALPVDACNNCTCTNGEMLCGAAPCVVDCGWSSWTQWSTCSRTCDVGVRRRYRSGTNPPPASGGLFLFMNSCVHLNKTAQKRQKGGGYRTRTRGPIRIHGTAQQFSACNLQPCDGGVCPPGQQWKQCVRGAVSCADLTMELSRNCTPGCQCPHGTIQQEGACVRESDCLCHFDGEQYKPGDVVPTDCNNWQVKLFLIIIIMSFIQPAFDGQWSEWTPWGQCSTSCGPGLQSRYRFCSSPQRSGRGLPCLGPHREDQVCITVLCDRDAGWGPWTNWTECTKSCGGGVRSRRRECNSPSPEGKGNYCEGLGTAFTALAPCSRVPGTVFSSCGPSCPRSCDDLAHCEWQCEPGCYCTGGKVLSDHGTACVEKEECPCMDLSTGHRLQPGETTESLDGCNNCTCQGGRLNCTRHPCPVSGGWCEWSEWTPCSRTCGAESVSRYRSCGCPEPKSGGALCVGEQETHNGVGAQIQRQPCPVITFCPVHGSWSPWSAWSVCDACAGSSTRTRKCNSPPARFGGLPCLGESRQIRGCHDNITVCSGCAGGQEERPCGKPCPRSCSDLHGDTECVDSPACKHTCGCPGDMVLQDGVCVVREECRCKYHNSSASGQICFNASWVWPGGFDCSCKAGVLQCKSVPGCYVDGGWSQWGAWTDCSLSCGGGVKFRRRQCDNPSPQSSGREVGCPPGRLYRECERGEGCPFSCAQVSGREGCYSDGCEEGCHCPPHTYQHRGICMQECPCLVDKDFMGSLPWLTPHPCMCCSGCKHGRWNCSLAHCQVNGGLSPWGSWSPCSLSCGGLGLKTRSKSCTQPAPAHGGRNCQGPRQETTYCQAPECPGTGATPRSSPDEDAGFSPWSSWSPCTRPCTDVLSPVRKSRHRQCVRPPCFGSSHQEKACNLPQCPDEVCVGADCTTRNCSWTEWGAWGSCSRSCGVGQQQRIRTFLSPRTNGSWCEDILGGHLDHRFCNIKPCRVDGGWSRWSPWSRCDKHCGGGRSIRTRSCSSPPPKNGGKKCVGEKNHLKPCNTKPCDERGCPPGQVSVPCANECPQRCSDLQQGIECQGNTECQPGCRCPKGQLQQDGVCVQQWQCDCVDSLGHVWAAGSSHQADCNNCSCSDGQLVCTNQSCQATCLWSSWSSWALCSVSCGTGQRTRYRSLVPDTEGADCQFEEVQHKPCDPGPCPPLCVHDDRELGVGDTWLQGECKQCTCTPEGDYCQDIDCTVDGGWTPWSVWSDCSVTCGRGTQVRTRACIDPPPRNNGSQCGGPEQETQDYDLCPWSPWSPCSRSCGAGSVVRRRACLCEEGGDTACTAEIEGERNREETQLCYKQPCSESIEMNMSALKHFFTLFILVKHFLLNAHSLLHVCFFLTLVDCKAPFVYSACGVPCEKHCALQGRRDQCGGVRECTPGCYCPQVIISFTTVQIHMHTHTWSEWTPCSPCVPSSSLQLSHSTAGVISASQMLSTQRRFRACLDLYSGVPVSKEEEESQCPGPLVEERLCPDSNLCRDMCQWSAWSAWTACAEPCSGGVRQRYRRPLVSPPGPLCRSQQTQSQSCNTGLCPGERCEDRGRTYQESCANQCPRSCTDLWEHVQCLQGACHSGCRCPKGQLLQDGLCVPVTECRCGIPSGNGTLEFDPKEEISIDCNTCVCENGTLACTKLQCPVYEPWSPWSSCSASCGHGQMTRTRLCQDTEGSPSCADTTQRESCDLPSCPECPSGQVFNDCSGSCPYTCEDLWPHTQCLPGPCTPGCSCSPGQVLYEGSCRPHADCPCSTLSLPPGHLLWNISTEEMTETWLPPGTAVQHLSCPDSEQWGRSTLDELTLCERSCWDIYSSSLVNCSRSSEGCVCREGLYRNPGGVCVIAALCPCHDQGIQREELSSSVSFISIIFFLLCKKLNNFYFICLPLSIYCFLFSSLLSFILPDEPVPECRRYVQVKNITKGDCRLDNVEVSSCRGRCLSSTNVILEEPYLQSVCECCSYRLDPDNPVRFLSLQCESGESEPVVLPVIHSCEMLDFIYPYYKTLHNL